MFPKKKRVAKDSLQALKRHLDRVFSEYIRLRDCDGNGRCRCITCQKVSQWKEMDAGHFQNRDNLGVRYNEKNVNAQCPACNRFASGRQYEHGLAIDRKWGSGTAVALTALAQKSCKLDRMWYEYHLKEYRKTVRELKKEKGL